MREERARRREREERVMTLRGKRIGWTGSGGAREGYACAERGIRVCRERDACADRNEISELGASGVDQTGLSTARRGLLGEGVRGSVDCEWRSEWGRGLWVEECVGSRIVGGGVSGAVGAGDSDAGRDRHHHSHRRSGEHIKSLV
eukprot:577878-Rhodomonas_salina.1